jgi:hypothetical protein
MEDLHEEVHILMSLAHPHIIKIRALCRPEAWERNCVLNDRYFFVMDLLQRHVTESIGILERFKRLETTKHASGPISPL